MGLTARVTEWHAEGFRELVVDEGESQESTEWSEMEDMGVLEDHHCWLQSKKRKRDAITKG